MLYRNDIDLMERIREVIPSAVQISKDTVHYAGHLKIKKLDLNYCQELKQRGELEKYLKEITII